MYFECHIETNNLTKEQEKKLKEQSSSELFGFYSSVLNSNGKDKTYFNLTSDNYNKLFAIMKSFCDELIRTDICIKRRKIELIVYDSLNQE